MVVTRTNRLARELRSLRDLRFGRKQRFEHEGIGFTYRMSAIQAALGTSQLGRIRNHLRKARWIARTYRRRLREIRSLALHRDPPWGAGTFWMYSVVLDRNTARAGRDRLLRRLATRGIETRPFFVPLHRQPVYQDLLAAWDYPVSSHLSDRGLNLPSGLPITGDQIETVCDALREELDGR